MLQVEGTWERGSVLRLLPAGGCLVELVDTGRVDVVARAETCQLSPELLLLPRQVWQRSDREKEKGIDIDRRPCEPLCTGYGRARPRAIGLEV